MHDLLILGGGPAGVAAGVYAARKHLDTVLITKEFGGQSTVSDDIQNWIGDAHISGSDLAKKLETHLRTYAEGVVHIQAGVSAKKIEKTGEGFRVEIETGEVFEAHALLLAMGSSRKRLSVPGADTFEHKGVTYCASCDGPVFSGLDVAVIGGGNAGFETAAQLLAYTKSVTLLDTSPAFKADPVTVEKVLAHPNMKAISRAKTSAILGEKMVTGLRYEDMESGEAHELLVSGVFVEIGIVPNTKLVEEWLALDPIKRIQVDPKNQRASMEGVWAAGDITDCLYHQNNIAAGDGVRALEDIYVWLARR